MAAIFFVVTLTAVPSGLLILYSFARNWFWPALTPPVLSTDAWRYVLGAQSGVGAAVATSTGLAVAVTIVAVVLSFPASRLLAWNSFPGKRVLLFVLLLPVLSPPQAATMGLHAMFLRIGLTETLTGVLLVHLIPAVPYTILMLTGSFTRLDPDLEAQARTLGASRLAVMRYVTLPAIAPGLAVAASFAFLISWSQYLPTLLIGGGRLVTLPMALVSFQNGGEQSIAAALCLVFIFPVLIAFVLVARYLRYEA